MLRRRAPEWLVPAIQAATTELLDSGTTTLDTWRGTVHAQVELPHGQTDGDLRIQRRPSNGFGGSSWSLGGADRLTESRIPRRPPHSGPSYE
jgi:hypothetical protein